MNSYEEWYKLINGEDDHNIMAEDGVGSFDLGVSESKLYCFIPWPGVLLWANDIRNKFIPVLGHTPEKYITINYCLDGRCEAGARDGDIFVYMTPGMLCIDNHEPKEGYHYPSGRYEGIELAFNANDSAGGFPGGLETFGIHMETFILDLKKNDGTLLGTVTPHLHDQMQALYEHLKAGDLEPEDYRYHCMSILYGLQHGECISVKAMTYATKGQRQIANDAEAVITKDLSKHFVIEELAAGYGISASALKKYFEAVYGDNFSGYLRKKRMELAMSLLETTGKSIGEIAAAAGYSHQGKFGAAFKTYTGVSPLEYRRRNYKSMEDKEENKA